MNATERIITKATSGRFIVLVLCVLTCCWITVAMPDTFGVRMFDFCAGLCVGYFGLDRKRPEHAPASPGQEE